jgi:hypothetical protein
MKTLVSSLHYLIGVPTYDHYLAQDNLASHLNVKWLANLLEIKTTK